MRQLLCFLLLCLNLQAQANLHVIVDPGHGGTDSGATSGSLREADIALDVALELKKLLENDSSFQVTLTRQNDEQLSLARRIEKAQQAKGDVFVSIHTNSSPDKRARGFEVYFQNYLPPDQETQFLANLENQLEHNEDGENPEDSEPSRQNDIRSILDDLNRQHRIKKSLKLSQTLIKSWSDGSTHSSIRQAPFYVITKASIPSVLIELGYLTNNRDLQLLSQPQKRQELAKKIHVALVAFKEKVDKLPNSPLN